MAIELPASLRAELDEFVAEFRKANADVRWESERKLHLTLKFLGDTDEAQVPEIIRNLTAVATAFPPFTLTITSAGCFPNRHEPRILWLGAEDDPPTLRALAASLNDALHPLGFEPEQKAFHAHITIGRVKGRSGIANLIRKMESRTFRSQSTAVTHIAFVKSELKPSGSEYTTLRTIPLNTGS